MLNHILQLDNMNKNICYTWIDEDSFSDFVKNIEKLFRTSPDYKFWLDTIPDRDICSATELTKYNDGVTIHIHHYENTLWDIVTHILEKFDENNLPINAFYICIILSELHMNGCISYVPLSHDVHDQIHNDYELTIQKYPTILDHVVYGNKEMFQIILDKYIKNFKALTEEIIND